MGSHALRFKARLLPEQVAALLRQVAEELERGALCFGQGPGALAGLRELRIALRRADATIRVKVKGQALSCPGRPRYQGGYRHLKRDMQRTWKALRSASCEGELPAREQVERLVEQGQAMMSFPGRGAEEHYPAFARQLQDLQRAMAAGDPGALRGCMDRIDALRREAHRRHR